MREETATTEENIMATVHPREYAEYRRGIINTARRLNERGLSRGRSGNVSVRAPDGAGLLITPSGVPYAELEENDIPLLGWDGASEGELAPSSEWPFHLAIAAARPEVSAVVHCHSPYATVLACRREEIPAFHYMVGVAGGTSIRCAPYATPGSHELAAYAVKALCDRRACLLANHGQIALGNTLGSALDLAEEVEQLAFVYWAACVGGQPVLLDASRMQEMLEVFTTYGTQKRT